MKSLRCLLGNHDFERLTDPVPTRAEGEFEWDHFTGHYALGKCRRCREFEMVKCWGDFSYYASQMKTKREWLEILVAKHEGC